MKRRVKIILLLTGLFPAVLSAQENTMFNNSTPVNYFSIGSDIITDLTGTVNLYARYQPSAGLRISAGGGFLPFGYLFDIMNFMHGYGTLVDRNVTNGLYFQTQVDLIMDVVFMKFFLYGRYKHWACTIDKYFDFKKNKFAVGLGGELELNNGFSVVPMFGIYMGYDDLHPNMQFPEGGEWEIHDHHFDTKTARYSDFLGGFDLGVGINYTFNKSKNR